MDGLPAHTDYVSHSRTVRPSECKLIWSTCHGPQTNDTLTSMIKPELRNQSKMEVIKLVISCKHGEGKGRPVLKHRLITTLA